MKDHKVTITEFHRTLDELTEHSPLLGLALGLAFWYFAAIIVSIALGLRRAYNFFTKQV